MMTKSGYLDFHKRIKRQGIQHFVKFRRTLDVEDTDIHVFARNSPEMHPLALLLKFSCPLVLLRPEKSDPLGVGTVRNPNSIFTWNNMSIPPSR
jgi:hypothetical protein